jgi:hypothetical protein
MTYKIRAPNREVFLAVRSLVRENARVVAESERRCMLSAEDLPEAVREAIQSAGATIATDFQWDLETAAAQKAP